MPDAEKKIADLTEEIDRLRGRISELETLVQGEKRGEEELRATLLRQNAILNNIPDLAWLKDRESRFIAVNGPFGEACGVAPADLVGKTDYDIWPRALAESYRADDAEVMRTGKGKRVEERLISRDGRVSWIETIKTPILDAQGAVIGTTGIARDITERRHAESKLRNVTRLYALMSQINQAIVRIRDREELFRAICRIAVRYGRFRMAWIGLVDEADGTVKPFAHAGHEDGYLERVRIVRESTPLGRGPTGEALREGEIVTCDDIATDPRMAPWRDEALKRGYRSSAAVPFRLKEKIIGTLNLYAAERGFFTIDERTLLDEIGVDISFSLDVMEAEKERRRAEDALLQSEERYRSFFENAAVAVAIVDHDGYVVQANDTDCRFLGYSRSELIGMHFTQFTHPQDIDADVDLYQSMIKGQRQGYEIEKRYIRKDGDVVWGRLAVSVIRDNQGSPLYTSVVCYDITERKRAEEALYLKNYVFDVSIAANSIADTRGIITQANQAFLAIWGYSAEDEVVGKRIPEFLEDPDEAAAIIAALDSTGKWEGTYTARKKDGSTFLAFGLATVLKDERGTMIGYQSSVLDITDRRKAEEALRESEERYRVLFQTMAQGVVYQASDGRIISANPAAERILGISVDQMKGLTSMDSRWCAIREDGSDLPGDQHPAMEALRTGKPLHSAIMGVFHPVDNSYRWILVDAVPEFLPGETKPHLVYTTFTDITDRRRAEEALKESEARMRSIIERAPFGAHSYELKPDNRLVLSGANPAADRILGLDHSLLIGKTIEEAFPGLVGTDLPGLYREAAAAGKTCEAEHVVYERDHINGTFEIHAFQSGPGLMTVFFRDITERKKAEEERLELERRLLHAQKLESLGVLAGGIAHDFNNLLMAILGNLDLALRDLSPASPSRVSIERSARAARRAADLTRQMLAYSGKGRFVVESININDLVEDNVHLFRAAVARTIRLDLRLGSALPPIEADAGQVQQVIMNLITNASEAIDDRAGAITLSTGVQECDVQCLKRSRVGDVPPADRYVYLEVSDTGCGMDEQTQQRLFDPFFSTKATGRGLGMSATLGIVRGHRGAVFVDSTVDGGTSIRVLFPAMAGAEKGTSVETKTAETGPPAAGGAVLIVDDEGIVRDVCKMMVQSFGMEALTAADGREGVEVFRQNADRISVVILDLTMPNMDGIAAFEAMMQIRPGVRVILSSGFNEQDAVQRLSGRGLAGFIQKPYSMDNLRDVLEKVNKTSPPNL